MTKKWSIKRERGRTFGEDGWTVTGRSHHWSWVLRYNGKRVATYRRWQMCIDHINKCVEKFGGRTA